MREDWNSFRDRTPANDRFYVAGLIREGVGASTTVPVDNQLYLVPMIVSVRSRLIEFGVCKTQGSSSTPIRFGLYQAKSVDNLLPNNLLLTSSLTDTTAAAFYSMPTNIVLNEGVLYYAAFVRQGGAALGFAFFTNQICSVYGYNRPTATIGTPIASFNVVGVNAALPAIIAGPVAITVGSAVPMMMGRYTKV